MRLIVVKDFAGSDICAQLNHWVDAGVQNHWLDASINAGSGWAYINRLTTRNYGDRFEYPDVVYATFDRITDVLDLGDLPKSVAGAGKDGVVVSCTLPGGHLFEHMDQKEPNGEVLRCNIMTRSADAGGKLYVGGQHVDIDVGDLHCYLASAVPHYVTEVKGNTARVLWMFGYQTTPERFSQIEVA